MHKKVVKKKVKTDFNLTTTTKKSSTYSPSKMQPTLAAELTNCEADPLAARARLKKTQGIT